MMTNYEFKQMLKERFIFCYSCPLMNYLRHENVRYVCKGLHEVTGNPFWLFIREPDTEQLIKDYIEKCKKTDEVLDVKID